MSLEVTMTLTSTKRKKKHKNAVDGSGESKKDAKKRKKRERENHEDKHVGADDHPAGIKRRKMNQNVTYFKKAQKDIEKKDKLDGDDETFRWNSSGEPCSDDEKSLNIESDEERNREVYVEGCTDMDSSVYPAKKKKKKKSKHAIESSRDVLEKLVEEKDMSGDSNTGSCGSVKEKKKKKKEKASLHVEGEQSNKISGKKAKSVKDAEGKNVNEGETRAKDTDENGGGSGYPLPNKSSRKVKFSGEIEIFPISDDRNVVKDNQEAGLLQGKRFSKDEDQILRDAVLKYIEEHDLGDDGINKVMHCRKYPEIRNCWKEISPVMPWRTLSSIYSRAHILFERALRREWTPEEKEDLRKFVEKYGPDWRKYADENGKHRIHVKDTWRRINVRDKKDGHWSQEEYQRYFNLVNTDLRMKVFGDKKSKHGMLRDDIAWGAISEQLSTRSSSDCCTKWYNQLTSPLVQKKIWSDLDDYRLLNELVARDFSSVEEVDWDNLLDHRPGDICRKRWFQMVNHLGEHGNKAFADQLEVLLKRYCPDVEEARKIYQNKTPVD